MTERAKAMGGGIRIFQDRGSEQGWKKIPGLYDAGTDACSIYGGNYVLVLQGNTMGFALNSGRIAGEHAVDYIKASGT